MQESWTDAERAAGQPRIDWTLAPSTRGGGACSREPQAINPNKATTPHHPLHLDLEGASSSHTGSAR
ncbi:hypothetical protein MFU01_25190 [Myxococcus fulvus]|uniref:Uncharacterized protein n=1 Tax=Myxococcus fulvus TaxID=33 RepID=A0A511T1F6_MYXFU|nr:hypothetical protein MFU01_25190 [Myxococcus fulvus]